MILSVWLSSLRHLQLELDHVEYAIIEWVDLRDLRVESEDYAVFIFPFIHVGFGVLFFLVYA